MQYSAKIIKLAQSKRFLWIETEIRFRETERLLQRLISFLWNLAYSKKLNKPYSISKAAEWLAVLKLMKFQGFLGLPHSLISRYLPYLWLRKSFRALI